MVADYMPKSVGCFFRYLQSAAVFCMLLFAGCSSVKVVRPLSPAEAGIKQPAYSVSLIVSTGLNKESFTSTVIQMGTEQTKARAFTDEVCRTITKTFEDALRTELAAAGFTLSQNTSTADFTIDASLNNIGLGTMQITNMWGIPVYEQVYTSVATWDISYAGPGGSQFGAVRLENVDLNDASAVPKVARELADFTLKQIVEPAKKKGSI